MQQSIGKLTNNKEAGEDEIPTEILQLDITVKLP